MRSLWKPSRAGAGHPNAFNQDIHPGKAPRAALLVRNRPPEPDHARVCGEPSLQQRRSGGQHKRKAMIDSTLVKRVGIPDDIAWAVLFLLDPEDGYMTGQALYVCGGTSVTGTGGA